MAAFSQAGEWLVDSVGRGSDVGWQMAALVREEAHKLNLTVDNDDSASRSGTLKSVSFVAMPRLDAIVHHILEDFVGLDLRRPSAITADWPLVRSPTPVVLAIVTYIVVVWVWSSSIKRAGLKPRVQDPAWLRALVVVHNCFLCCLSFYMGCGILFEARRHG